jgi:hypothetical protein
MIIRLENNVSNVIQTYLCFSNSKTSKFFYFVTNPGTSFLKLKYMPFYKKLYKSLKVNKKKTVKNVNLFDACIFNDIYLSFKKLVPGFVTK